MADSVGDNLWRGLRTTFPFHLQTVGLSQPDLSGERTLIIAEPPPTLPRASFRIGLQAIFGYHLREAHLMRQPIGYDGWVEDIVATLRYPAGEEGEQLLRDDLTILAERLYGTAYKFAPIRLPARGPAVTPMAPPSLDVSAAELKAWLLDSATLLTSVDLGTQHGLRELLRDGHPGVYLSPQRGLVVLILPRDYPINAYRAEIRKFALDSDAVVGAVAAGASRLAIVGRERDTPLDAVPALRAESILMLAATRKQQLSQSYERLDAFAGKLREGPDIGKDWAPIYLSRELVNTEVGSLLNITDQMLKSWSEAGQVKYVRFPYPKPSSFPFPGGLIHALGAEELTYNWNTVGVGAVFAFPGAHVFALTRTGSLPVSYFPTQSGTGSSAASKAMSAEDKGYDYFSALRDPYLGRVVEYSAIYQIFRAFPVQAERNDAPAANWHDATKFAVATTRRALRDLAAGRAIPDPAAVREQLVEDAIEANRPLDKKQLDKAVAEIEAHPEGTFCRKSAAALNRLQDEVDPNIIGRIAVLLADRSSVSSNGRFERLQRKIAALSADNFTDLIKSLTPKYRRVALDYALLTSKKAQHLVDVLRDCLGDMADIESIKANYVAIATRIDSGYIKTASIVLSSNPVGVGGHNLYSHATLVEVNPSTPRGLVGFDTEPTGAKILQLNPEDAPHANAVARVYERHADDPSVEALLKKELRRGGNVRRPDIALQIASAPPGEGRGLTQALEGDTIEAGAGFRSLTDDVSLSALAKEADARGLDLMVARDADGYLVLRMQPKPVHAVRAPTEPAMIETMATFAEDAAVPRLPSGLPPLRFGAGPGIDRAEILGIVKTQELRLAAGGGGGWGRPPYGRSLTGDAPAEGTPQGWFFDVEGGGKPVAAYGRLTGDDQLIVLRSIGKDPARAREALGQSVDWSKADVTALDVSQVRDEMQLAYEISIPIKTANVGRSSLAVRVISYFKRLLSPDDIRHIDTVFRTAVRNNASKNSIAGDGIADLKADILRNVAPDRLEFHLDYGAGDVIIVDAPGAAGGGFFG